MRNILLASTALVAFAGAAAAEVSLSGSAEMGIVGASDDMPTGRGGYAGETVFHQSVDVRFTLSGEADGGLSFGAVIDLDDLVDTGADPVDVQGDFADFTVFISGDFGTLTMGDTDGAFDWALQEVNIGSPGSLDDDETEHAGYSGNSGLDGFDDLDGQVLRYEYIIGDFGIAVSAETDDSDEVGTGFGIGARYTFAFSGGTLGLGLGYQMVDDYDLTILGSSPDATAIGVSAAVTLDMGLSAAINYSAFDLDGGVDGEHFAIGMSYTFDAITVHANYGVYDWDSIAPFADSEGFGLAASYDLGGGLSGKLGYGYSDVDGGDDWSTYSLGLAMSF